MMCALNALFFPKLINQREFKDMEIFLSNFANYNKTINYRSNHTSQNKALNTKILESHEWIQEMAEARLKVTTRIALMRSSVSFHQ